MKQRNDSTLNSPRRRRWTWLVSAALLLGAGVSTNGCADVGSDDIGTSPQAIEAEDAGVAIANHPLFAQLSSHGTSIVAGMLATIASMDPNDVAQLEGDLEGCTDPVACEALVQQAFGLGTPDIDPAANMAAQIANDVGLAGAPPEVVQAAFQHAQILVDDQGDLNAMLSVMLPNPSLPCSANSSCVTDLGITTAMVKGEYMAELVLNYSGFVPIPQGQGESGLATASSALAPAIIAAIITAGAALIKLTVEAGWQPNEANKECTHDSDCPADEYCHKVGSNDCRPRRELASSCSRHTQCASNCCRLRATGPRCRPSSRCD